MNDPAVIYHAMLKCGDIIADLIRNGAPESVLLFAADTLAYLRLAMEGGAA